MKTSKTILVGVLAVGSIGFAATSVLAANGSYPYGGRPYPTNAPRAYITQVAPGQGGGSFAPAHPIVAVQPGDSLLSICQREYGNPNIAGKVAEFNRIPQNVQLSPGMQVRLPVINPNGSFG